MMTVWVLIILAVVLLILLWIAYNSLVTLRNKVNEAFSTMDVFLKKRSDLIPGLVEAVRGYSLHESAVLQQVAMARSSGKVADLGDQLAGEARISDSLKAFFIVAEAYPELKANNSFFTLQQQLSKMEDEISLSRRYYNGSVREYNNRCQVFPLNLVALIFGFKPMPMFAVGSDTERQAVNVNL
ncbi:MAG: LemA family protein [Prevotella sp.]